MTDTDLMSDEAEAYLRARHRRTKAHQFDEGISCECMRGIGHSGLMGRVLSGGLGCRSRSPPVRVPGPVRSAVGHGGCWRNRGRAKRRRPERQTGGPARPRFSPGFVFLEG